MKLSDAFPSKYIKAGDLQGRQIEVEINSVEMENLGDDHKPVVYFVGKTKGFVLNKTNGFAIAKAYGDDTDNWTGQKIIIFPTETNYAGKMVEAIRVIIPQRRAAAVSAPLRQEAPPPAEPPAERQMVDHEIPF